MPEDHFRQALRYQVADVVPLPVDEANPDHILLDDLEVVDAESGETRRVARMLLVAAPRNLVDGMVRAEESAGLRVVPKGSAWCWDGVWGRGELAGDAVLIDRKQTR